MTSQTQTHEERMAAYRLQVRETMGYFSDQALRYQSSIIRGGIDREECDREIVRRQNGGERVCR